MSKTCPVTFPFHILLEWSMVNIPLKILTWNASLWGYNVFLITRKIILASTVYTGTFLRLQNLSVPFSFGVRKPQTPLYLHRNVFNFMWEKSYWIYLSWIYPYRYWIYLFCIYPCWIYVFGYIHLRYIRIYPSLLYPQKDILVWIYPKKDICELDISGYIAYIHGYRNSGYTQKRYICWIYPWI